MGNAPDAANPRLSVVIPVYNTVDYLAECLDSLLRQDMPIDQIEIIAVDDGSTDGSGELLDRYGARARNLRVVHQPNSGWPGQPRNLGLSLRRGKCVFFVDSDDIVAVQAMRRLCDFADRHGSDIVQPLVQRIDRRREFPRVRGSTVVDGDPRVYFRRLGPIKLFRRAFREAHDLRFPEGLVRLEDGILLSRGYLLASRVSVLRDYGYYFRRRRDAEDNISLRRIQPAGYISSVRRIADNVRDLCDDPPLADDIILDLYQRRALRHFRPGAFLGFPPARRRAWVKHVARLAEQHIPRALQQRLATVPRLQSEFVRRGDMAALMAIAEAVQAKRKLLVVTSPEGIHLEVDGRADRDITDLVTLPDKALVVRGSRALRIDTHAVAISLVRSVLAKTRRRVRR